MKYTYSIHSTVGHITSTDHTIPPPACQCHIIEAHATLAGHITIVVHITSVEHDYDILLITRLAAISESGGLCSPCWT